MAPVLALPFINTEFIDIDYQVGYTCFRLIDNIYHLMRVLFNKKTDN